MSKSNSIHTPNQPATNPHKSTTTDGAVNQSSILAPPQPNAQLGHISHTLQSMQQQEAQNLYGINPQQAIQDLMTYLQEFCVEQIGQSIMQRIPQVLLDLTHLQQHKPTFFAQIQATPDILLLFGDLSLRQVTEEYLRFQLSKLRPEEQQLPSVVELFNNNVGFAKSLRLFAHNAPISQQVGLRSLSPFFIDKLISVEGLLISKSEVIPEASQVTFWCQSCEAVYRQQLTKQTINVPARCARCSASVIKINYDQSEYASKLQLKLQEAPDSTQSGETPVHIGCQALLQQADAVACGDTVRLTCIYRVQAEKLNQIHSSLRAQFRPFLDVVWIDVVKKSGESSQQEELLKKELADFQNERRIPADIQRLVPTSDSEADQRLQALVASIAPSIYGQEYAQIKLALLLQAVRGCSGNNEQRSNIHVLLIGDPGQAKSQLIKFMTGITPRSIYTSGKNSTQAGLTATVSRGNGVDFQLEPGTLVLCSGGVCALDEFDKLDQTVRGVLHECMEQQTVSVAKAGVVCTLQAQTAVLAAANPVDSKYNVKKTVVQNLNLDASLISRFDLIFLLLDNNEEEANRKLANHLLSLYFSSAPNPQSIDAGTLQRYIQLAREQRVTLADDARVELERAYLALRKSSSEGTVAATPRQLLAVLRLAQARAKLRFADRVTVTDVKVANRLLISALKMSATNERGMIDVQLLAVDKRIDLERIERFSKNILQMLEQTPQMELTQVIERLGGHAEVVNDAVDLLVDQGHIVKARGILFLNQ